MRHEIWQPFLSASSPVSHPFGEYQDALCDEQIILDKVFSWGLRAILAKTNLAEDPVDPEAVVGTYTTCQLPRVKSKAEGVLTGLTPTSVVTKQVPGTPVRTELDYKTTKHP